MSNKPFILLGKVIPEGKRTVIDLKIAKLHTRTTVNVPVIIERSQNPGPVVLLLSGIHGDETNGVGIVREIINLKLNKPKKGTIICIPVFNIFGYLIQTREFPDGRDLNRMFPGTINGSLASQFAYQFTKEIAPLVDYVIDFHTGGGERDNIAQIRCSKDDEKALELAKVFNPPMIVFSENITKSLRETLHKMGKTVLLFEGGKSNELNPTIINEGVNGTKNILIRLGLIEGEITVKAVPVFVYKSKWLRASDSGMFKIMAKNGSFVKKREILGVIQDPFGEFKKKIYAPFNCHIFCINKTPIVNKGDALFHVSITD
ncbi:succinylglutamate desuccinylase/aspartoacylase family protein [Polaribacter litorisediminis]|uniref:succinylglutamate desuccinylase/aspartoacylase family protein n=1 Tax=Polaribacter litorisediminis TaxID=1908341 RepID=UPI001CC0FDF2|nr:succinylglutamate desuccinylase/aspartoacylase family protein [Polaribacter litorisediminis]UAM99636.1 succinylglutamate desuccinylase/aspartoacylase family protein [Polaribacter litorisediminis]